ncbi:MAG TPA: RNA polymerase sigma factor [Methylomirabilota bacterium]|nr:RNA polymerase sigma factor [Methylomirabilota bacterium]
MPRAPDSGEGNGFQSTHWSAVITAADSAAPGASEALDKLCHFYWFPLYAYVRRLGHTPEDSQDLTQEFFRRLLEKKYLRLADRERGRFRSFLLTGLKHFLVDDWRRGQAVRRGGGKLPERWDADKAEALYQLEASDQANPERAYERRWAVLVLDRVLERLGDEFRQAGKSQVFEELKSFLWAEGERVSHADLSSRLGVSEGAARVTVHRFRRRYRELLQDEIGKTVAHPGEIEDEIHYLFRALS